MGWKLALLIPVLLAVVAAFLLRGSNHGSIPYDTDRTELNEEYDFIVVGAGSAGSVVASRLSENKHVTVLLLEAGGDDDSQAVKVPLAASSLVNTERDWKYRVGVNDDKKVEWIEKSKKNKKTKLTN